MTNIKRIENGKTYSVYCPVCSKLNNNLNLFETNGKFKCECCNAEGIIDGFIGPAQIPVFTLEQLSALYQSYKDAI